MTLRGPEHPDNFRVKVGRYGDRWYIDNLPDDGTHAPMTEPVPSVSAVKNAFPKFLTQWSADEAATFAVDNYDAWSKLDRTAAIDLIRMAHKRSRDSAADRGTAVHAYIESLSTGALIDVDAVPAAYEPVIKQMVDELQPEFVVAEAVAIKRDPYGYGGTIDGAAKLNGYGTFAVDWKTRKPGKGGTAYPDEFAQVEGYMAADYFIVGDDNGGAKRIPVPDVDGIAVVTIDPDGYHVCVPDDRDKVRDLWTHLRRFWAVQTLNPPRSKRLAAKLEGGGTTATAGTVQPVGSVEDNQSNAAAPVTDSGESAGREAAGGTSPAVSRSPESAILHEARTAWLINRTTTLVERLSKKHLAEVWPTDVARPLDIRNGDATWTDTDIDTIATALDALEAKHDVAFGDEDPKVAAERRRQLEAVLAAEKQRTPTRSGPVAPYLATRIEHVTDVYASAEDVALLDDITATLRASTDPDVRRRLETVQQWQREGDAAGVPWKAGLYDKDKIPQRVWSIVMAAIGCMDLLDPDAKQPDRRVRDALATVTGEHDLAQQPTTKVGAMFGLLTTEQAEKLATIADATTQTQTHKGEQQ